VCVCVFRWIFVIVFIRAVVVSSVMLWTTVETAKYYYFISITRLRPTLTTIPNARPTTILVRVDEINIFLKTYTPLDLRHVALSSSSSSLFSSLAVFSKNENICIKSPLNAKPFRDQVTVPLHGMERNLLTCVMRIGTRPYNNLICINTCVRGKLLINYH